MHYDFNATHDGVLRDLKKKHNTGLVSTALCATDPVMNRWLYLCVVM